MEVLKKENLNIKAIIPARTNVISTSIIARPKKR